jgi:hypothetical protein
VRLPSYKYYSGKVFTYKLGRMTVTVGAPSMLAISTSPASVGASSSACIAAGSSAPAVVLGSSLLSTVGACGSTTLVDRYVIRHTSSSTMGLDCGFFQPACPPCPSPLLPLDQQGRMRESLVTTQKSIVSIQNTSRQVLDYSTRGAYLLRCSLGHLQFLGDALACHIAGPPRRHRETSLQASRWIFDKRDVGQSRAAEPRP